MVVQIKSEVPYHFQVHDILNENIFVVRKRQM